MYYTLPAHSPYAQICLPLELAERLSSMNESELKVLLHLHAFAASGHAEGFPEEELLAYLEQKGIAKEQAQTALAYLRGAGLLLEEKAPRKRKKSVPVQERAYYTAQQLTDAAENSEEFKTLRDYAENRLGKLFNTAELSTLYSFTDSLKLSPDVIMLVMEYCAGIGKGSLQYIEKILCDLCDKGLTEYEQVEKHINDIKEYQSFEWKIRSLCGFQERALTKKEKAILVRWKNDEELSMELVSLAYERTIASINKPSLSYMQSILERWRNAGITTPEEAEALPKAGGSTDNTSYDTDDFFQAAVAKTRGKK